MDIRKAKTKLYLYLLRILMLLAPAGIYIFGNYSYRASSQWVIISLTISLFLLFLFYRYLNTEKCPEFPTFREKSSTKKFLVLTIILLLFWSDLNFIAGKVLHEITVNEIVVKRYLVPAKHNSRNRRSIFVCKTRIYLATEPNRDGAPLICISQEDFDIVQALPVSRDSYTFKYHTVTLGESFFGVSFLGVDK